MFTVQELTKHDLFQDTSDPQAQNLIRATPNDDASSKALDLIEVARAALDEAESLIFSHVTRHKVSKIHAGEREREREKDDLNIMIC